MHSLVSLLISFGMATCTDGQESLDDILGELSEDQINDILDELDPEVYVTN